MADLAELYIVLDPFEATDEEYAELGERIQATAVELARQVYAQPVTIEVVIVDGSAKIKTRVFAALLTFYGVTADWKSFKEQMISNFDSSVSFLSEMSRQVSNITHVPPAKIRRKDMRLKASKTLRNLTQEVDNLKAMEAAGMSSMAKSTIARIQKEAARLEKDLEDEEIHAIKASILAQQTGLRETDLEPNLEQKRGVLPRVPEMPVPERTKRARRKSRVVFQATTDVEARRRIGR
jgi:hypothetical protein